VTATTRENARWARGLAVALVTAPGVLLAQFVVADALPSWRAALIVCAIVAAVACAVPTRGAVGTAAIAGAAQLAGHVGLALTGPQSDARQGCLSVVGRGADLGVRYALVRGDACPPGALSAAPALAAVVSAVAGALVVLLGHALLAGLTGVLVATLTAGVELVRRLADAVRPVLTLLVGVRLVPPASPTPPVAEPPVLTDRWQPDRAFRRGPPPTAAAA
jgi:hypothetical protein